MDSPSLEGQVIELHDAHEVARAVDLAFDYRGDVTLVMRDGAERVGYVFDRRRDAAPAYLRLLEPAGEAPVTILYTDLRCIRFTGRDTAAGKSYAAWRERRRADSPEARRP